MTKKLKMARRFIAGVFTAFMLVGFASANAQAPPVPDNGWIFSEQDGETAGPTFGDAAGTLSGGVEWDGEDPFGGAGSVSFDGSDGTVVMEDLAEAFNDLANFSLSIWIKANDTGIDRGFWEAVDSGGGDLWGLRYDSTGATAGGSDVIKLGITTSESGGNTNRGADQQESHEGTQTTEWQHILMTWEDGEGFNLYIDGELDEPTLAMVTTGGTTALMDRFVLGDGAKAYWDGYIDEVAVWTSTLTADNAAWLAENSIAGLGGGGGGSTLLTGLIGYWPLEAGDGTTAANAAGGEDAELHNGVEWVDDPDRGTVLSFDGVDAYGDAGAETIPQMTQDNDFTWSVWINQGSGNGPNNVVLGNRYSPGGGDFAPREFIKYTPTKFEFHLDGGGQNCEYDDLANSEGEWVHYVVVKTGNSFTHYSNGEEGESSTFTSELQNPQPFYFGGDKTAENWNGMLDDIAIWERALSASEVSALYSGGIPRGVTELSEGLIGYWPFDDQSGTTKDLSENGNDGTVNGEPEWVAGHSGAAGDSAIQFDGQDDSVTTEVSLLNDLAELTLSFWMLMPEQQPGNRVGLIGQNDAVEYGMINPTTMQYWTPAGNINVDFGPTIEEWTHVAVVVNSDGFVVYANGEVIGETGGGGPVSSTFNFNMGGDGVYDATGNFFLGSMDDVAVYNIALSPDDIAALASGDAVPIVRQMQLVPGLIAYWPFDGDLDDAVGDSHGTGVGGDPIEFTEGQFGQGIDLDGVDQFIETPVENEEMFDFQDGTGFSISAWFRVDAFTKSWQALIAKGEGNRWRIHRRGGESIMTGNGGNADVPAGPTDVNDGEIHHLVLVSDPDGGEVYLYVDGELEATGASPAIQSNDNPMMIGENPDARNRTWDGLIDDVGIWARPISADEVATIYNGGAGAPLISAGVQVPKPRLASLVSNAAGFSFLIKDVEGAAADADSVVVTFDGAVVEVTKSKADGVTSVSYDSPELLAADSEHTLSVALKDTNGNRVKLEKAFKVKPYTMIDAASLADASLKGESGFLVYATQISSGQGVGNLHGNNWGLAEKQINGEFIDPDMEEPYLNEADLDSFEGWSYYPEIVEVVNQNQDAPAAVGNFHLNNGYEDEPLTGIPGWGDSTDGIASEYIALLDLARGAYKLGVNSDDGFSATIGANFGDLLAQQLGLFNGGRGAADTTFEIFVDKPGLYPFRVSWWEGGGGANIEIFSFVNGEKTLINDPDVEGSIKAYTITGAVVDESTTVRATTGRAKVVSVSPTPGDTLVKSSSISVVVQNEDTTVKQDTAKITLNGEVVDASVSKDGSLVTISYTPDGGLPVGTHTVAVSFEESNGIARGTDWSFSVPGIYKRDGDVPTEAQGGLTVREYHGIGTTDLNVLFAAAKYPDSPDLTAIATYFEWPQSGDINVNPAGNVRDNYGWHLMGYIHPPETGEYIFAVATDDNSQLWLSTDDDPANAVQLTQESTWTGVRNYLPGSDESTSAPVFLEAGKAYFIECFAKEGGGGDNMAVAWSTPDDGPSDVDAGSLPISGEFLSPYTWTGPQTPELGSVAPTGIIGTTDYTVSVTINNGQNVKVTEFTKLEVDGKSILGDAETTLGGISSSILADGEGDSATEYTVLAEWKNSDGSTGSTSWSFMTSPHGENALYIEAEDFNYDGGEWMTFEETAGGGAYDGLEFVADIDIHNGGNASPNYRFSEDNHPGMADSTGFDGNRGDFDMDIDFKMGWNDAGDWYNYTRDFPAKVTYYNVIGRFSSGGAPPNNKLSIVTSDPTEADQTIEDVGVFQAAAATACWDCFEFFPMTDATGNLAAVKIGGETTVRLSIVGGNSDLNYLMFVPAAIQEYPPAIVSTSPTGLYLDGRSVDLTVVLTKREAALTDPQLSLNGEAVATDVATDGDTITLTGSGTLKAGDNTATVSFNGGSTDWTITIATPAAGGDVYALGTKAPATAAGSINTREYLGVGGVTIPELTGNANFPDSPDVEAYAGYFEWPQSGDINTKPAGNVKDNYGVQLIGFVHPPETGSYTFVVAADDNAELWLSTDEDPANRQLIAVEPQWNGVRAFAGGDRRFVVGAGTDRERFSNVSSPISLEAGKAYFIEALMNEGGGGDNLAVAWTTGDPIANDALPIGGEHLSPWVILEDPGNLVSNGSFEADDVPEWPGYGAITGWEGGSGINDGGPFGDNGVIPDGAKLGFIQGTRTLSQQLTGLEAGAEYVLAFYYNARNCCGGTIGFTVSVGGEELGSVSDVEPVGGENPYNSASYSFVAAGSDAELVFSATAAGDATLLLDAVSVSRAGEGPEAPASEILIDFAGTGPNSAGASPDPWISINNLVKDVAVDLGGGVTITALDDGFNPNNPAQPGVGAEYDGVSVPQEARNDYLFKIADAAGTTARMRIDGLAAGTYNVTVFEGRTTDASQFAKIWTGEEPATENTGDFAKGSATVTVTVGAGESLWYMHLEDGSGGVSGMMIRQAVDTPALSIVNNGDGTVTVTFEGRLEAAATVNGPWQDTGATSPLTTPADAAMQYARAVSD